MRRMLAPVAFVAAFVLAPSSALAAVSPVLAGPASPSAISPIHLTWNNVSVASEPITYQVYRAGEACATATTFAPVGGPLVDILFFDDSPPDGTYCYEVTADDGLLVSPPSISVPVTLDRVAPVIVVTPAGGDGCTTPFTFTATASDPSGPVTLKVDGADYAAGTTYTPAGDKYAVVSPGVVATDGLGNANTAVPVLVSGRILDDSGPGPVSLEINTDPPQQQATLTWEPVVSDGAAVTYHLRIKGPQGVSGPLAVTSPVTRQNLEDDATYEFTLEAVDECNRTTSSVRLVRLNDSTPPSMPLLGTPGFNPAKHTVALSWVASSDNIQVDHYVVLRDGVPLGVTDTTGFTDLVPPQHTRLNYAVRAVDTNGNATDSAPAPLMTPDWTQPSAPLPTATIAGTTVTLRWPPATDNVGVVSYLVMRDDTQIATMTAAVRTYRDANVKPGVHTWRVLARDDAQLTASSAPITRKISKATVRASVLSLRMVGGGGSSAARYSLKPPGRLLVDVRVVGTLAKPRLRLYVNSGRGRITVWRGVPGTSTPRVRLGSGIARHGFVLIHLNHALHAGHIRLVLIAGGRVVIAGKGGYRPAMIAG